MRDRPGLIEAATDGTLFLDEIGEMSLPVQGRLLRAIELGEIRRLGENRPRKVNTRFVGATHRDLSAMVRQGAYRPWTSSFPPAWHRGGDPTSEGAPLGRRRS